MRKGLPGGLGNIRALSGRGRTSAKQPSMPPDQQRKLWDTQVRQGSLSPVDAEKLASDAGQHPFVRLGERHRLAVQESLWPLTMAIFWVAWEDLDRVAQAWAEFEVWRGHLWSYPSREGQKRSLEEAEHIVFEALRSGRWTATALHSGERYVVEPPVWVNLRWEQLHSRSALKTSKGVRFEDARIDRAVVIERSEGAIRGDMAVAANAPPDNPKNLGGRNTKYDWDGMWIEIVRMSGDGEIQDRESLQRDLMSWWANKDPHPADSTVREKLARLFKTLGWQQKR